MDDFEFQQALESLAYTATTHIDTSDAEDFSETALRWQRLFAISEEDAMDRIVRHRNDLSHAIVGDEHWETVKAEKEADGFDREAYEYELTLQRSKIQLLDLLPTEGDNAESNLTFLLQLSGPFVDMAFVRFATGLSEDPVVVQGKSMESWNAVRLGCIDAKAKANVLRWSSKTGYEPIILLDPRSLAGK